MLLARLSDEEKEWFSSLVVNLIKPSYLKRYNLEMGIDVLKDPLDYETALDKLSEIEDMAVKKAVLLELACISVSESENHLENSKKSMLIRAANTFKIDNVEEFIAAAKELVPAQRKAFILLGIW